MGKDGIDLSRRTVLVTGADGFIGSHLAEELVRRGATVRAMVQYNSFQSRGWLDTSELVSEMEVVACDICDRDRVAEVMAGADTVMHLAALIAIPYSYHAPESYVRTNVTGTLNVLQAARQLEISELIHTSTSEVYGTARYVPIDEAHPLQGQSPYSASKIASDVMVQAFHLSFGLPAVTVRPFNTYGPRQSPRAVIPTIIGQCLAGATLTLGNLTPTRDFTFVTDTVAGMLAALGREDAYGQTVNLGTGSEISIADLGRTIAEMIGVEVEIGIDDKRVRPGGSEVERLLSDNGLAREVLGWAPEVSLHDGLARTIEWVAANRAFVRSDEYAI
jgi:NAD dependent epimerase/dehydratase